jgi:hypothetical protein
MTGNLASESSRAASSMAWAPPAERSNSTTCGIATSMTWVQ